MWIFDQAQQPPPLPPPAPPPPAPPPPAPPPLHPQPLDSTCHICLSNIRPDQAVIRCTRCRKGYHYGELTYWLTTQITQTIAQTCPTCREDMSWVLNNQQPLVNPAIVAQQPQNPNNNTPPGLQPAELLDNIISWNWDALL